MSRQRMVPLDGDSSNTLFKELADWEYQLKKVYHEIGTPAP